MDALSLASLDDSAVVLAEVVRDGVVESLHRGHVAVVDAGGTLLASAGQPDLWCYPRSALKPAQAAAVLSVTDGAGITLSSPSLAIATASHDGSSVHQIEAAYLLALADLDESALRCPASWPDDRTTAMDSHGPSRLAHNCSGKHAGFLLAQTLLHEGTVEYLEASAAVQRRVRDAIEELTGVAPGGPGVDGCGAPAWLLPLDALGRLFGRMASTTPGDADGGSRLARVAQAMRAHPELVGGEGCDDTRLMRAGGGVVAKRGAEGVFAAGTPEGVGIAVKVSDGDSRAVGPVLATLLGAMGITVPVGLLEPAVLGGGEPHGSVRPSAAVRELGQRLTRGPGL